MAGVESLGRVRAAVPGLLVVAAALAAHHPILSNGFIEIDDPSYITSNPFVRGGLTLDGVVWAFTSVHLYNWHPLTSLSHLVDVSLWGLEPAGHHLGNWLLHAANCLLVLVVLGRATGVAWRSAAVALLFAVHPVHVESVAWASERKDVLSTFFLLLCLGAYVGREGRPSPRGRARAFVLLALGLLAKPMVVMAPVLMLLLDFWPLRRLELGARRLVTPWSALLEKSPLFVLAAASAAVTIVVQNRGGQGSLLYESPFWLNAGNAFMAYVRYPGILVWPADLALVYPFRAEAVTWPAVLGALAVLVVLTAVAFRLRGRRPYLLFGWLWYLAALLPVAGFLRFGYQAYADRYLYVPALGLYVASVWGAAEAASWLGTRRTLVLGGALAVVVALLGALTVRQARFWRSSVTLLEHTVALQPDNPLPRRALAAVYARLGRVDLAAEHMRKGRLAEAFEVVALNPASAEPYHRLGAALAEQDRPAEAVEAFRRALALDGGRASTCNSLGLSLARLGRTDEAREAFREAVRLAPSDPLARHNLEVMERSAGEWAPGEPPGGAR